MTGHTVSHLKRSLNVQPGDRTRIHIKLCQSGQTDHYMLGYVQKDSGMAHLEESCVQMVVHIIYARQYTPALGNHSMTAGKHSGLH